MPDPTCLGSPFEENCSGSPTCFIYTLDGMPVYFCEEHYWSAVAWLLGKDHGSEEADKLAEDVLNVNARMGNQIRQN